MGVFVRAQSSIETLLMVAIGLLFLVVIVQIIFSNVDVYYSQQQQTIGVQALSLLASEIDDVYFSGPGTVRTVIIEIPEQMDLDESYILGKSIVMTIDGTEHVRTTRVPVRGVWPNSTGAYSFKLVAYGDFVAISTDLLELNPNNVAVSLNQDASTTLDINILNLSSIAVDYTFSINFVHANATVTSSDTGIVSFFANDYNQITLNFSCSRNAVGTYDGNLLFDGTDDVSVPVKLYCVAAQSRLSVYPSSKDFNQTELTNANQTLQVCNSSSTNYSSSSSSVSGEISAYAFTSFSGAIPANSCRNLDLNIIAPATGDVNIYLGTLSVTSAGFTVTSDLNLFVLNAG